MIIYKIGNLWNSDGFTKLQNVENVLFFEIE